MNKYKVTNQKDYDNMFVNETVKSIKQFVDFVNINNKLTCDEMVELLMKEYNNCNVIDSANDFDYRIDVNICNALVTIETLEDNTHYVLGYIEVYDDDYSAGDSEFFASNSTLEEIELQLNVLFDNPTLQMIY